jgi:hypothetical protein
MRERERKIILTKSGKNATGRFANSDCMSIFFSVKEGSGEKGKRGCQMRGKFIKCL